MAVVGLSDRKLLVYSPIPLSPAVTGSLDALGDVAYVLSPNKIHNQTLAAWAERYPRAELHAPPGLAERRPGLPIRAVLGEGAPPAWSEELEPSLTAGNVFFSEVLLFHRRSRTLLVGDLVENFDASTTSAVGRGAARLFGVGRRPVASPEFRYYTHDAAAAAEAFSRVARWDFERIFLCHGAPVVTDAKHIFREVTDGVVDAARRRSPVSRWLLRRMAAWQ